FSVPQLPQRIRPLYSFECSETRKPPLPVRSSGNLLPSASSLQHAIDILRTGIHGWQQLCPFESPEGRLSDLQQLPDQRRRILNFLEALGCGSAKAYRRKWGFNHITGTQVRPMLA